MLLPNSFRNVVLKMIDVLRRFEHLRAKEPLTVNSEDLLDFLYYHDSAFNKGHVCYFRGALQTGASSFLKLSVVGRSVNYEFPGDMDAFLAQCTAPSLLLPLYVPANVNHESVVFVQRALQTVEILDSAVLPDMVAFGYATLTSALFPNFS